MLSFFQTSTELAGAGMAVTFQNVTGFSLLVGFGSGLIPLASQAYGAGNVKRVGSLFQRQVVLHLVLICIPISFVWLQADRVLEILGQPQDISRLTKSFLLYRIPALPFYALQLDLESLLQCVQAPVFPRTVLYIAVALLNVALLWFFIIVLDMGFIGAPLAVTISNIAQAIALFCMCPYILVCNATTAHIFSIDRF